MTSTDQVAPVYAPSGAQGKVHKSNSSLTLSSTLRSRSPAITPTVSRERGTDPDAPWTARSWVGRSNKGNMFRALQKAGEDVSVYGNAPWKDFTAMDLAQALVASRNKRIDQGIIEGTPIIGDDYERKPRSISSTKKKDILRIHTAPAKEPEPISKREFLFILRSLHSHLVMIKNAAVDEAEASQYGSPEAGVDDTNAYVNPYPELCSSPGFELDGTPLTDFRIIMDCFSKPMISEKAQMLVRTVLHHQHELRSYHQQCGEIDGDRKHYLACLKEVYYIQRTELWREMMKSVSVDTDSEMGKQVEAIVNDTFANVDDLQRDLGMVDFRKAATNVR